MTREQVARIELAFAAIPLAVRPSRVVPRVWAVLVGIRVSRLVTGAAAEFARENSNMALQYADWLTGGDVASADEIKPGAGAIVRRGLEKIAAYRDGEGRLHERLAGCPHLGCVVHWNPAESTWDCPCHGSRFDPYGKVISGPANRDLAPAERSREQRAA